jgi:hypothetical protein
MGSKRLTAILLLAVLLTALASAAFGQDQKERVPKFFVRKTSLELGEFYEGEDISYVFTVRNNGLAELVIENVRPG